MRWVLFLLTAILCLPLAPGCSGKSSATAKIGDPAASLEGLTFVKGGPILLEPGKIYIIEFWATWCPPCRTSIPHLTKIAAKYRDRGVIVIGVSNESERVVKPFVDQQGDQMDYVVAVDSSGTVGDGYMRAFAQQGIPHAFLVDSMGKIAWHGHPMDNLESSLDKVLAAK
ncbi:MAG: redoxin domain-containing protein [Phycisphaerae bacterium]|nr:redoxin domain-containing protein [Phycisphaerae bacterium]